MNRLANWLPKPAKIGDYYLDGIRQSCECLLAFTEASIEKRSPRETGKLFGALSKCVESMVLSMVYCTNAEANANVKELAEYVKIRCPAALFGLASFTSEVMREKCDTDPAYATAMANLRNPHCTYVHILKAAWKIHEATTHITVALHDASCRKLREQYSWRERIAFLNAVRRAMGDGNYGLPLPARTMPEFNVDDTEAEYKASGPQVELSKFCRLSESVPERTECLVCMTEIGPDREQAVVTKCGHLYHEPCLDDWVNKSAMKTSNMCPTCRTVLCKPRERLHASLLTSVTEGINDDDTTPSANIPASNLPSIGITEARALALGLDRYLEAPLQHGVPVRDSLGGGYSIVSGRSYFLIPVVEFLEAFRAEQMARGRVNSV